MRMLLQEGGLGAQVTEPGVSGPSDLHGPPPDFDAVYGGASIADVPGDSGIARFGSWLKNDLFRIGEASISPLSLLTAFVIVLLAFQVSRILRRFTKRGFKRIGIESEGTIGTTNRLLHYGVVVAGLLIALQQLGIKLEAFLAAGAIFAVAFGFAMQNIAQNFVSGMILLVERSIKPGDVLEVEGNIVRVVEMGIRATVARTRDEEEVIVPNSLLVQNTVKNYTLNDSLYRLRAQVGVTYASDMELVSKVLTETAEELEWREKKRAPRIHLLEFGESAVLWEVSVWIQNPWLAPRLRSRLHEAIWWALKERGIVIAFPQLDVHLDARAEASLRRVSAHAEEARA